MFDCLLYSSGKPCTFADVNTKEAIYTDNKTYTKLIMSKSYLYFICCVSAMGGLLFGYDWVVIGGAKPFY